MRTSTLLLKHVKKTNRCSAKMERKNNCYLLVSFGSDLVLLILAIFVTLLSAESPILPFGVFVFHLNVSFFEMESIGTLV